MNARVYLYSRSFFSSKFIGKGRENVKIKQKAEKKNTHSKQAKTNTNGAEEEKIEMKGQKKEGKTQKYKMMIMMMVLRKESEIGAENEICQYIPESLKCFLN